MKSITYEYPISELQKEVWGYWFDDRNLRLTLDRYDVMERQTKRHKWRVTAKWDYRIRRDEYWNSTYIKRADIPQRDDVRAAVLKQFIEQITIE